VRLLSERAKHNVDGRSGVDALHRPAIERVIAAMRGRVDDALPLHVMAEIACFSPYPFARSFRQITGIPPASS
jgi:transcriptional regulator GlxA family with amidase domain